MINRSKIEDKFGGKRLLLNGARQTYLKIEGQKTRCQRTSECTADHCRKTTLTIVKSRIEDDKIMETFKDVLKRFTGKRTKRSQSMVDERRKEMDSSTVEHFARQSLELMQVL